MSELTSKWKSTPLHTAVGHGHLNIVKFFISNHRYDLNIPGECGRALFHYAAECGHLHIAKYLTDEQGYDPPR